MQKQRQTSLPLWEDYVQVRHDNVGSYPCIFLMEYAYGLCIPSCVYEHEATKTFFREVTVAILIYVSCGRDLVTRIIADKWLV